MFKLITYLFLGLFVVSCANQQIALKEGFEFDSEPDYVFWDHYFISGIAQKSSTNAQKVCADKGGVAGIAFRMSFYNYIGSVVGSYVIGYSPRSTEVYCNNSVGETKTIYLRSVQKV